MRFSVRVNGVQHQVDIALPVQELSLLTREELHRNYFGPAIDRLLSSINKE